MSNLTTAAPAVRAGPMLDDILQPTQIPGSIEQPIPPHPLELLKHSVRYRAEYPYGQLCLNDYTAPQQELSALIADDDLEDISDEAQLQATLVESLINSHFGPRNANSALLIYEGSLCRVSIRRRLINLRTMYGAEQWDHSPYVQAVRRHRAPQAVSPAESTTTSLAQGAIKPDAAIVLALRPFMPAPGAAHYFPVLIGKNKFSSREWRDELEGHASGAAAVRGRLGLVLASRESLFQAAEYLTLAGELGKARYGFAIANCHFYRLYRQANGVIALEVPDQYAQAALLTVDELRELLKRWNLPPNRFLNLASRTIDIAGLAKFSGFVYQASQLLGTGQFMYDLAHARPADQVPAMQTAAFQGSHTVAAAAHVHRRELHEQADKAKKKKPHTGPVDPVVTSLGRRSRSPGDDGGQGPSGAAGGGSADPQRPRRKRKGKRASPGQRRAAGQSTTSATKHAAHQEPASTPSPPTAESLEALQESGDVEIPDPVLAWATTVQTGQQVSGAEGAIAVDKDVDAKVDDLVDFGESSAGPDPVLRAFRHLRNAEVRFRAVTADQMDHLACSSMDAALQTRAGDVLGASRRRLLVRSAPPTRIHSPIAMAKGGRRFGTESPHVSEDSSGSEASFRTEMCF